MPRNPHKWVESLNDGENVISMTRTVNPKISDGMTGNVLMMPKYPLAIDHQKMTMAWMVIFRVVVDGRTVEFVVDFDVTIIETNDENRMRRCWNRARGHVDYILRNGEAKALAQSY